MKIGDILLCSGTGPLSKLIIKYNKVVMKISGPAAEISHVAMIGTRYNEVFEATTLNEWCGKKGVQINPYNDWIQNYDGRVWLRRSSVLGSDESAMDAITSIMRVKMQGEMCRLVGTKYEHGIPGAMELALAGFAIPWLSNSISQWLRTKDCVHCSEVDALVEKAAGVFPITSRPNKLPPCLWWDSIRGLDYYYDKPEKLK